MSELITIKHDVCIMCGRCVAVCPSMVYAAQDGKMTIQQEDKCISCGQCVAACPQGAIVHANFPSESIHRYDRSRLPDSESLMLLIKGRRSNRAFSKKDIPAENLDKIIEAARYAPTASNGREVKILLITDKTLIKTISDFTIEVFRSVMKPLVNPLLKPILKCIMPKNYGYLGAFQRLKREHDNGNDQILRGAKAVIFFYTPAESRCGCQDSNLAYQNASLMAEALGVAHFYTGFVCNAASMKRDKLNRILGIEGKIHAGMALAMPTFQFDKYMERK